MSLTFQFWVGDPRNFHNSALLKNDKKNSPQKRCKPPKIGWHSKNIKKIEKRERTTKNEKMSNKKNVFLLSILCYRKIYILLENVFRKT